MKRVMLKDEIPKRAFLLLFGTPHTYNLYARVYDTIFNTINFTSPRRTKKEFLSRCPSLLHSSNIKIIHIFILYSSTLSFLASIRINLDKSANDCFGQKSTMRKKGAHK